MHRTALFAALFLIASPVFAAEEPLSKDECRAVRQEIKRLYAQEKRACSAIRDRDEKQECKEDARDRRDDAMEEWRAVCG